MSDWHGLGGPPPNPAHLGYTEPEPPVVPDKDALDSERRCCEHCDPECWVSDDARGHRTACKMCVAASPNGYVVVPRHLLDELTEHYRSSWHSGCNDCIQVSAAVVEAVGPTREDTR